MSDRSLPVGENNSQSLVPFEYGGIEIRTVMIDGEPWFVARDVCDVLGLKDVSMALSRLDEADTSQAGIRSGGQSRQVRTINESGLYDMVIRSDKPEAKPFRRWITSEVLPTIRQTGSYGTTPALPDNRALALMVIAEADRADQAERARLAAEEEFGVLMTVAKELAPAATAWERLAEAQGDYSVNDAAKILKRDGGIDTGQKRLFQWLRANKWINVDNTPYQRHVENGRLRLKAGSWTNEGTGDSYATSQVRVTFKGLEDLRAAMSSKP